MSSIDGIKIVQNAIGFVSTVNIQKTTNVMLELLQEAFMFFNGLENITIGFFRR